MAKSDLRFVLEHLRRALPVAGLTDGELLGRFVACRDEAAFEALVHRHGGMVFSLCRRLLSHADDVDDAFQTTFLILVRKARSVVKRESVGSWLYGVAHRTALAACAARARRQARERQGDDMPHPAVAPAEPQDWRPLLDRELAHLPPRYREAVVLYHLEGRSHREVARLLGVPEGTLSSRLVKARRLLAGRLARCGVSLSGCALVSVLAKGVAPAAVPTPLVAVTVRAATLCGAGQLALVPPSAAVLMRGVLQTMFLKKLTLVLGVMMVTAVLGATGLAYRTGSRAVAADEPQATRPMSELEVLRRENRLLRLNLEVVLEKVHAQEVELRGLREKGAATSDRKELKSYLDKAGVGQNRSAAPDYYRTRAAYWKALGADGMKAVEDAMKTLREARDPESQQRAADALERAVQQLRGQMKPGVERPK